MIVYKTEEMYRNKNIVLESRTGNVCMRTTIINILEIDKANTEDIVLNHLRIKGSMIQ
jgi:hypothetical protein